MEKKPLCRILTSILTEPVSGVYNGFVSTILIVDDDLDILGFLKDFLGGLGHAAVGVADGYSVIATAREHKPDLVILDYQLPAGSGKTVFENLRNTTFGAAVPVIFLSATPKYEIMFNIEESPLVRFLEKPIDSQMLKTAIEELLGK